MAKALARPIKTKRDYHGAASIAKKNLHQTGKESAAEHRLQALLDEIEKFDDGEDVGDDIGDDTEDMEDLPRRRWSDDPSDSE